MAKKLPKGKLPSASTPTPKRPVTSGTAARPTAYTWQPKAAAAIVVGITLLIFLPTLSNGFVNWDDPQNILENENLKPFTYQWDWKAVYAIFTSHVIGNYNPLPIFTFAIEQRFFAPEPAANPFIFHFNNLWMHLVCTLLVFVLFRQMKLSLTAAALGALLFGIHPMRVESVAWITERKDVLYGMFFLGALCAYVAYTQAAAGKMKWYAAILLLSVFSYFAKVQAVTLPLTMVALDYYFKRKWYDPKILIVEKLPWWLLSLAFGLINIYFLKQQQSLNFENAAVDYTLLDRLAVGAYTYAVYLVKTLIPYQLSPLYPYPPKLPLIAYISLAVVPLALLAFLVWAYKKQQHLLLFGWAFFTFNVMFLLQIVGAGQGFLADRFTYIAYIGLFFLIAKGFEQLTFNTDLRSAAWKGAAVFYLCVLAFLTYRQIAVWKNGGTLWEHVKTHFPNSPLAWKQAAVYYRDDVKDTDKAIANFREAIRLLPEDPYAYNGLAKIYIDRANSIPAQDAALSSQRNQWTDLALEAYLTGIRYDSIAGQKDRKMSGEMIVNLGVAYAVKGNLELALRYLEKGLQIYPEHANGYLNMGLIYYMTGQYEKCRSVHQQYFRLNPYNADIYYEEGLCLLALNQPEEALKNIDKAISLKNTVGLFYLGRATALRNLNRREEALAAARVAQQMGVQVPEDYLK